MEKPTSPLPVQNNSVTIHTKPYEIKTLRVAFSSQPSSGETP
jgi:hypothetical protein